MPKPKPKPKQKPARRPLSPAARRARARLASSVPARREPHVHRERREILRELARGARLEARIRAKERAIRRDVQRQRDGAIDLARILLRGSEYEVVHREHWTAILDELQALRGREELARVERERGANGENASLRGDVPQGETADV